MSAGKSTKLPGATSRGRRPRGQNTRHCGALLLPSEPLIAVLDRTGLSDGELSALTEPIRASSPTLTPDELARLNQGLEPALSDRRFYAIRHRSGQVSERVVDLVCCRLLKDPRAVEWLYPEVDWDAPNGPAFRDAPDQPLEAERVAA